MAAASTPAEVRTFFEAHPQIRTVELLLPDINGILRGKRITRGEAATLFGAGLAFPVTAELLDSRGGLIADLPHGLKDGDPDHLCRAVPGSLAPVPWAPRPLAQCLTYLARRDGSTLSLDSRQVLAAVLGHFTRDGLTPVVAVEYEFYLLEDAAAVPPRPRRGRAPGTRLEAVGPRVYSLEDLHELDGLFADIQAACAAQGLPAGTIITEYGPGQFEVNLHHVPDALLAADHAILLRRVVRGVARRHGLVATFMAKPFAGLEGSGMHVHVSLLDGDGRNIFAPGAGAGRVPAALRHGIGGLLAAIPESMAIFAPNANSYRRIRPGCFAPISPNWGPNHRHVAVRLPLAGPADARFEHRVAGADCNPYLALAAVLAALHHGITQRIEPAPMVAEGEVIPEDVSLAPRWERALDDFDGGRILAAYLGAAFCRNFSVARRFEAAAYQAEVPDLDYRWYLPSI